MQVSFFWKLYINLFRRETLATDITEVVGAVLLLLLLGLESSDLHACEWILRHLKQTMIKMLNMLKKVKSWFRVVF